MPDSQKEKLVELICDAKCDIDRICIESDWCDDCPAENGEANCREEYIADHLIANGVTVQELDGCIRCKDSQQMTVTISNKLVDGVNTGWLGGNLTARFCPFCGRRLPQPPKGE